MTNAANIANFKHPFPMNGWVCFAKSGQSLKRDKRLTMWIMAVKKEILQRFEQRLQGLLHAAESMHFLQLRSPHMSGSKPP